MSDSPLTHARELLEQWRGMIALAEAQGPIEHDEIGHANRWETMTICADELSAALLADTRAATAGTSIGTGGSGLDIYRGAPADAPSDPAAASAPTRETGWRDHLKPISEDSLRNVQNWVRVALEATDAPTRQRRAVSALERLSDGLGILLPTPPRDERPQT